MLNDGSGGGGGSETDSNNLFAVFGDVDLAISYLAQQVGAFQPLELLIVPKDGHVGIAVQSRERESTCVFSGQILRNGAHAAGGHTALRVWENGVVGLEVAAHVETVLQHKGTNVAVLHRCDIHFVGHHLWHVSPEWKAAVGGGHKDKGMGVRLSCVSPAAPLANPCPFPQ